MKISKSQLKRKLYVLIACEESQAETFAFRQIGVKCWSCDVQPCRRGGNPDWHIHADVTPFLSGQTQFVTQSGRKVRVPKWDLIIAHPPCTYLCRVTASIIYNRKNADFDVQLGKENIRVVRSRYVQMLKAREFFYKCLGAKAQYVAVENPVPLKIAQLPQPTTFACPSWFGVRYTKKTCYWLRNLPPLMPTIYHSHPKEYVHSSRGKYRSRTFPELAQAIAQQWTDYILDQMQPSGT